MPLQLWSWVENLIVGVFTGAAWAIGVMWNFYRLYDDGRWDSMTAPDSIFIFHLLVGLIGGVYIGLATYRWLSRRMAIHHARGLESLFITRRKDREMADVMRGSVKPTSGTRKGSGPVR